MRKLQHQQTSGRRTRHSLVLVGALVVGSLLAAACGGDDSTASDTTTAGGAGAPAAFTGAPIKVMTETAIDTNDTPYENIRDTAKYYAQWVNEQGGLKTADGKTHELQVTFCDDKYDANEAANCARKAVDEKMVANIGGFTYDVSRAIADLRGGQDRLVRRVLPCRRPGEQFEGLLSARLHRRVPRRRPPTR